MVLVQGTWLAELGFSNWFKTLGFQGVK